METNIIVREAKRNELEWINSQYDLVEFKHSSFDDELICIVEVDGKRVGSGRLQNIEISTAELGGIFVQDGYRGMKLASKIVSFLIESSNNYTKIFCLPFAHLSNFYKKFGFTEIENDKLIHNNISQKYNWCNEKYEDKTLLFVLDK